MNRNFTDVALALAVLLAGTTGWAGAAEPLAQAHRVVYHNRDSELYVEGPGLIRLEKDGGLVAIVPVVPRAAFSRERRATDSRVYVLRSADGGQTWQPLSDLPYYSAAAFQHAGSLYLLANKGGTKVRNDDLLILRSTDGGATWADPMTLFSGHYWNCHTGMVIQDDTLYWAVDDLALRDRRGPRLLAGDLRADLMSPRAWRLSEPVPFPGVPDALINPKFASRDSMFLEPNVISVAGTLRVLCAVKPAAQTTTGLAAVFDATDDRSAGKLDLKFVQYHPQPGGQLKFCVIWDEVSKLFWMTSNLVVDGQDALPNAAELRKNAGARGTGGNDRRFLMLYYGRDGLSWFPAGCIARADKLARSFMYARPVIDGEDLAIISRTSVDAPDQHDADYATFHRVRRFRELALDLGSKD